MGVKRENLREREKDVCLCICNKAAHWLEEGRKRGATLFFGLFALVAMHGRTAVQSEGSFGLFLTD